MKFIIFICTRLSNGQYPRLPDFPYNSELGKYVYQGRELTLDEFNDAARVVFEQNYRSNGYHFCPMAILPAIESPSFRIDGQRIYSGDNHVAGLFGEKKHLRVLSEYSDLRAELEDWLANTQPDPSL